MTELVYNYIAATEDNHNTHMWTAVGDKGGIHVWACPSPEGYGIHESFYGGIEVHRKMNEGEGNHETCWLLGCACQHDGSSLYFSERIEPMFRHAPLPFADAVHEWVYVHLHSWYESHMGNHDTDNF
ncbi:hypothetical protein SmphiM12_012 [Sinorhizobium phage phiM12]|uniref:Uncharacterized protein n=1 Tax=Sinorhizobium phage phiM12 TaxID=1357423 RepID=S5MCM6_9CAUD|nr:hypothetical protein AB690_gp008 [Sinorhizobium phage phiM12]AGR47644.1 hypothetical protein SmphiM12_012 [Sinorhizobium phage phiM12]AKF12909.1 hypothetical protein PHIM19_2 [Sinorhizobium phage phiM19]